jgi:hypothetical protein
VKGKIAAAAILPLLCFGATLTYKTTRGSRVETSTWTIEYLEDGMRATESGEGRTTDITYDTEGRALSFAATTSTVSYTIRREGNQLEGRKKGTSSSGYKRHSLGRRPWVQSFATGLRPFAKGTTRSFEFAIVNPRDLDMHTLVAKRRRQTSVICNKTEEPAIELELSLGGIKGMFWKAKAWVDPHDYTLLKYEGNEGPNTPLTTIELMERS